MAHMSITKTDNIMWYSVLNRITLKYHITERALTLEFETIEFLVL